MHASTAEQVYDVTAIRPVPRQNSGLARTIDVRARPKRPRSARSATDRSDFGSRVATAKQRFRIDSAWVC